MLLIGSQLVAPSSARADLTIAGTSFRCLGHDFRYHGICNPLCYYSKCTNFLRCLVWCRRHFCPFIVDARLESVCRTRLLSSRLQSIILRESVEGRNEEFLNRLKSNVAWVVDVWGLDIAHAATEKHTWDLAIVVPTFILVRFRIYTSSC